MAKANSALAPEPRKTVEEWAAERKTAPYVLAAVKVERDWADGKVVTAGEYDAAVDGWLKGSVSGR